MSPEFEPLYLKSRLIIESEVSNIKDPIKDWCEAMIQGEKRIMAENSSRLAGYGGRILVGLLLLAASLAGVCGEEGAPGPRRTEYYDQQVAAAQLTRACQLAVQSLREARGIPPDPEIDPNGTGLIGVASSDITTCVGSLPLKRTTANPNFAAIFVRYFKELHLERGDVVTIGTTGSFPALAVAILAAAQILDLEPILICSLGSSQYGANTPELTLPEIVQSLYDERLLRYRPTAVILDVFDLTHRIGLLQRDPEPFRRILRAFGGGDPAG